MTPATVAEVTTLHADIEKLLLDQTNAVVIGRTASGDQTGKGQLYYTTHLKTYQPVEEVEPLSRGVTISREYRLADCGQTDPKQTCPAVTQAKVGDVLDVKLTVVVPNSLYYVVVEDPLPAGAEALDTSLKTTSKTVEGPQIEEENEGYDPWADWGWQPTHVELRDEKAVLFADRARSRHLRVQLPDPGQPARRVPDPAADRVADVLPGGVGTRRGEHVYCDGVSRE